MELSKSKVSDIDFLYLSTSVRSMENKLFTRSDFHKMIEMKSFSESLRYAADFMGIAVEDGADYDTVLSKLLTDAYDEIEAMLKTDILDTKPSLISPLRFIYDCHNLKSAIKCEAIGTVPQDIYIDCGTVKANRVTELVRNRSFDAFPAAMRAAAKNAIDTLAGTKDPQAVDFILDRAAFCDMTDYAEKLGQKYLKDLIAVKCDIANISAFVRCTLQKRVIGFLQSVIMPYGNIPESFFTQAFDGGFEKLFSGLKYTDYHEVSEALSEKNISVQTLEKVCEDIFMNRVRDAKYIPFGPEIAIAYLEAKEYEIKNLRIVLSGKSADISPEILKERLRVNF